MTQPWRKYFPLPSPRKEQGVVLDRLVDLVNSGERIVMLEAGTGVGKSAIAVCMANYIRSLSTNDDTFDPGAYVLTSQKILQDQYLRDFPQACDIRSSANFQCTSGPGETCGQTIRHNMYSSKSKEKKGPASCAGCPYRTAKDRFVSAPIGVTNYSYFLSETVYAGELKPRELLILDEAHNIESEMRKWSTIEFDEETATRLGISFPFRSSKAEAVRWILNEYRPALSKYIITLTAKLDSLEQRGVKRGLLILLDELDRMDRHICGVNRVFNDKVVDDDLLVDWEEQQNGKRRLRIQPLDSGAIAREILYTHGKHVLMMSATMLDRDIFMKSAGVNKGTYVSCPTPFPSEHFGIVYRPAGRMGRADMQKTLPKMVQSVRNILKKHPKEKGIIHCSSYEVTRAISGISDRRLLVQGTAKDREEMLKKHRLSKEPTVLVSPSMMEGLDLEGDLGRFQVICKVPFPNMGDPVVEAKMKLGGDWYAWCTARTLIQAIGRCVRGMDDTTHTYILDESFGRFFENWAQLFPHYFGEMDIDV